MYVSEQYTKLTVLYGVSNVGGMVNSIYYKRVSIGKPIKLEKVKHCSNVMRQQSNMYSFWVVSD